jgi:4-alpha-glucanotransferase
MARGKIHEYFHRRRAGVLLHPTSLPSADLDGPLGDDAERFIEFLVESGFSIWQMLPVHPVDEYGSPYRSSSVHAGNPQLINLQRMNSSSWMVDAGYQDGPDPIAAGLRCFQQHASDEQKQDYKEYKSSHKDWLDNYALYSAIKKLHKAEPWWTWPDELRVRNKKAIELIRTQHTSLLERYYFEQFMFFSQWQRLRQYANSKGILLFGDMPIFTAHDCADVWMDQDYFKLDENGHATVVAGVPPDYFSSTGQRWGNPLYNWDPIGRDDFEWWINRLHTQLELYDLVRIDHFRGFEAAWEIPVSCETAMDGEWKPVPGEKMFKALRKEFNDLPLVAEDLGIISAEVVRLRKKYRLPGMKVLQFAFDSDAQNPYLPHNHEVDGLVCTGSHDNNTTLGWFNELDNSVRERVLEYLQNPTESMPWPLIQTALASVCRLAVIPMQDLLELGASHRMNTPGTVEGNWKWRFEWQDIKPELPAKLRQLNAIYGRH